ncbi:MAG: TetR/AcrR family transcriptional regulator [Cryomorphaceae bacterium]|nr:TetR/AcrR family transcriptional regulator [Cryomorphaceae bacterium]
MLEQESQKNAIVEKAMYLYMQFGLRSVSMDQIASELGISKKTIYRYFESKADLVHEGVVQLANQMVEFTREIAAQQTAPIDEIFAMDETMRKYLTPTHQRMIYQLKKYFPRTFTYIQELEKEELLRVTVDNIKRGIKTGYYRENINPELIAHLYLGQAYIVMSDDFFWNKDFTQKDFHREALIYHIYGISAEKGRKHLEKNYL